MSTASITEGAPAAGAPAGPPVVEAVGITKRYGPVVALDDVRLRVEPGESHALVGRNGAGKSTLVKILTGLGRPDAGTVRFAGEDAPALTDRAAWQARVACVYQHSTVVPGLTVAENIFLNRQAPAGRRIRWGRLRTEARELLDRWRVDVDVDAIAGDLTVEATQLVEIARALSFGARFIVLDEPTAQLDGRAIGRLFEQMRVLQAEGVTFLFISHHLAEVYEVCQAVTVYRDARHIVTSPVADLDKAALIDAMTGEPGGLTLPSPRVGAGQGKPAVLEAKGLSAPGFTGVDLTVAAGEVVGIAGASGSGKTALAETLVGLRKPEAGTVEVDGRPLRGGGVREALKAGVGFVPEDRHRQGIVPELSVAENASMTIAGRLGPGHGFISPAKQRAWARERIEALGIVTAGPDQPVEGLSGGNQQKVVMARALASDPKALVLINPTAGVDVKSKESLLGMVDRVRDTGTGVVIVSDELDDLRPCDRVVVLHKGTLTAELQAGWQDGALVAHIEGVEETHE
jgi:simple sugar transport system ATP-binding protein